MNISTALPRPVRFGSTPQENGTSGDGSNESGNLAHLGDMETWLKANLNHEELAIAQSIADMARAESAAKAEQGRQDKAPGKRPAQRETTEHIPVAQELAKQFPGIQKLGLLINEKIRVWRAGGANPKHFFAELSQKLRIIAEEIAPTKIETEDRGKTRKGDRRDRRGRRAEKWGV